MRPTEIEKAIANWEESVSWIEKGWDCEQEYICDVTARHAVFLLLENNSGNLPAELLARLNTADARYRAATVDDWPFTSCDHIIDLISNNIGIGSADQKKHPCGKPGRMTRSLGAFIRLRCLLSIQQIVANSLKIPSANFIFGKQYAH